MAPSTLVSTFSTTGDATEFWKAIEIFINRSNIINRRLVGEEILREIPIENDDQLNKIKTFVFSCDRYKSCEEIRRCDALVSCYNEQHQRVAVIKRLLPKNDKSGTNIYEVIDKDIIKNHVSFYNGCSVKDVVPSFAYGFSYTADGGLNVWVDQDVADGNRNLKWIVSKLVPKLLKWMEEGDNHVSTGVKSLSLVDIVKYSQLYNKLKESYGKQLVKMWPENTDPLKFVYEDIGIATYLLLLWEGRPKQRFVDLGCGNGLLVHILNSEGHLGIGYDIRARKIWSMYPPSTKLQVQTIIPSSETVFPEADWLIGNHSDELTVWIPVMAANSSYSCSFFVLPCCPYNFNGKKYGRVNSSVSPYTDFLNYVDVVSNQCGFISKKDKLRIPSTKRICFVGSTRTYTENEYKDKTDDLWKFVNNKMNASCDNHESSAPGFVPRKEEKVRNCTKVETNIREKIVSLVSDQLLAKRRLSPEGWNYGGALELGAIAKIVPSEMLKKLKSECGGLKTLLKNHHQIFIVCSGKVKFRIPVEKDESACSVWKTKQCWFYHNHPQKCPIASEKCSFIHEN